MHKSSSRTPVSFNYDKSSGWLYTGGIKSLPTSLNSFLSSMSVGSLITTKTKRERNNSSSSVLMLDMVSAYSDEQVKKMTLFYKLKQFFVSKNKKDDDDWIPNKKLLHAAAYEKVIKSKQQL